MNISQKIEAVLFWKGEPVTRKYLSSLLKVEETEINEAVIALSESLNGRGITLIQNDSEIMLGTDAEASNLINQLAKDEIDKDLGKAGLETLSIVLYEGPISRADIDYIRGVNSQFILRNLLIRGLVERVDNPSDSRSFLYKPTIALLSHLGVNRVEDLPEFESVRNDISTFKAESKQEENIN